MYQELPSKGQLEKMINKGMISKNSHKNIVYETYSSKLGEFLDVLLVVHSLKPLAALDFTPYGRSKLKKLDISLINKVIELCNIRGVKYLHHTKTGGMYLKSIFFLDENYQQALNLMYVLWLNPTFSESKKLDNLYLQYYIGYSLGYSEKNILFFLKDKFDGSLTKIQLERINKNIREDRYTLESFKPLNIKIKETIKKL
jgi:hypothetical protein